MACGHKCIETAKDWWLLTISGWVYFFFSLFFWWPIIILKRRRNASGLGNKVASSIILSCRNTQKKKKSPENIVNIYKYHFFQVLVPFSVVYFLRSFQMWGHLHWIVLTIVPLVLHFVMILISCILLRMILLTFLAQTAVNVDLQFPGVIRWKVHLLD